MDNSREERIRQRAYALWEQEGRPEGRHLHHWRQARQEAGDEELQQQGEMKGQRQQGDRGSQAPSEEDLASEQQQS